LDNRTRPRPRIGDPVLELIVLEPIRPSSRAPHRTGAVAHGLADILAYQADRGHRGRRTETAQTRVSQNAGTTTLRH
jgi:hypothetical protein